MWFKANVFSYILCYMLAGTDLVENFQAGRVSMILDGYKLFRRDR